MTNAWRVSEGTAAEAQAVTISNRRVVTGLDSAGRSCVIVDEPVSAPDGGSAFVWRTDTLPASNAGKADAGALPFSIQLLRSGSNFVLTEMRPGTIVPMHATDTIDYAVVLRGEIVLVLEDSEVVLRAGDLIVNRGVLHRWRVDAAEPVLLAVVTIVADPVGQGATI
jgi:quercetin dioxygenase-like cupin family protein